MHVKNQYGALNLDSFCFRVIIISLKVLVVYQVSQFVTFKRHGFEIIFEVRSLMSLKSKVTFVLGITFHFLYFG